MTVRSIPLNTFTVDTNLDAVSVSNGKKKGLLYNGHPILWEDEGTLYLSDYDDVQALKVVKSMCDQRELIAIVAILSSGATRGIEFDPTKITAFELSTCSGKFETAFRGMYPGVARSIARTYVATTIHIPRYICVPILRPLRN